MSDRDSSEASVVRQLAERTAKRVTTRVIRSLQRVNRRSRALADLESTWDEICVQVQSGESIIWEEYQILACAFIRDEVEKLSKYEREALRLQTERGADWECEDEAEQTNCPAVDDDIVDYLWGLVWLKADEWSNERIRAHLGEDQ